MNYWVNYNGYIDTEVCIILKFSKLQIYAPLILVTGCFTLIIIGSW